MRVVPTHRTTEMYETSCHGLRRRDSGLAGSAAAACDRFVSAGRLAALMWRAGDEDCTMTGGSQPPCTAAPRPATLQSATPRRVADIFINIFSVLLVYTYVCSKVASGSRNIINIKNCSLSVVLTATEQRPQNHYKGDECQRDAE